MTPAVDCCLKPAAPTRLFPLTLVRSLNPFPPQGAVSVGLSPPCTLPRSADAEHNATRMGPTSPALLLPPPLSPARPPQKLLPHTPADAGHYGPSPNPTLPPQPWHTTHQSHSNQTCSIVHLSPGGPICRAMTFVCSYSSLPCSHVGLSYKLLLTTVMYLGVSASSNQPTNHTLVGEQRNFVQTLVRNSLSNRLRQPEPQTTYAQHM